MKINDKGLSAYSSCRRGTDKEGFLFKKGADLSHSYKRRWFVLKGNLLFYFDKSNDRQPIGMIILENCSVEVSDADRFSFCIRFQSLQASTSRTYTLCADNETDMERWMKSITSASYGYLDMLVKEFEKNLQRLKALEAAANNDFAALSQEQNTSEVLLSKAKPLLDHTYTINSLAQSPKAPPRRSKHSDAGALVKEKVAKVSTVTRMKTKSLSVKHVNHSSSSDNIAREKSPNTGRKTIKGNRVSAPSQELVKKNNILLPDVEQDNDKTTFEQLHTYFGGAIWTRIGETL
eukprot:TCONS_00047733-protein